MPGDLRVEELAYLAGLFDGEGSLGLKRYKPKGKNAHVRIDPRVSVTNTRLELVEPFQKAFGGSVYHQKRSLVWQEVNSWEALSSNAISCIKALLPYLREPKKREAADWILYFWENRSLSTEAGYHSGRNPVPGEEMSWRLEIFNRVKILNLRGV